MFQIVSNLRVNNGEKVRWMDIVMVIRQIQLEKTIGELNALRVSYYDPMGRNREKYKGINTLIQKIIRDLKDNC